MNSSINLKNMTAKCKKFTPSKSVAAPPNEHIASANLNITSRRFRIFIGNISQRNAAFDINSFVLETKRNSIIYGSESTAQKHVENNKKAITIYYNLHCAQ